MSRLKRLTIHKLPHVRPGTQLVFSDGINVILGINGSGKTTLLKLLSQVCSGVFKDLRDSDFHLDYEFEHAGVRYTATIQHKRVDQTWKSELSVALVIQRPDDVPICIDLKDHRSSASYGDRKTEIAELASLFQYPLFATAIPSTWNSAARDIGVSFHHLFGVDARPVSRFDESGEWLAEHLRLGSLTLYSDTSKRFRTPDCVGTAARAHFTKGERDELVLRHDELDFLNAAVTTLDLAGATMRLDLVQVVQDRRDMEKSEIHEYGRYDFRFVKRDGARLRLEDLSFGQRRFFSFLYYGALHPEILIADELTNGMHHAMISHCLDLMEGRQAFLSAQNPLLLDGLGFSTREDVQRCFILCSLHEEEGQEQMVWRNMSAEEAENFHRDHRVGISHVSDILRSWGLW